MPERLDSSPMEPYISPVSVTRKSFDVVLWRKPLAVALCYEGYSPTDDLVEPEIFDLFDVQAHPGNQPGTGTLIVRTALAEAKLRGFAVGRSHLLNPRMVTIMSKLQNEGVIDAVILAPASTTSTEDLRLSEGFGVSQSVDYISDGLSLGVIRPVDCVFEIK
jgi:hypothetical protein